MTKNNSADCLVCGESYLLDARLLDYCGTCCAHEIRHHSPEGCLPECRFCAPGGCSDCGAYVAPDAECSNCQRGPRAARELEITWTERHPATPRAERFNAYVRDLTRVPSYLASGLGPSPAAAITDALELAAAVQLEEAADADLIERRRALEGGAMERKPTIAEALAVKLGRTPTHAELTAEVKRILRECATSSADERNPRRGNGAQPVRTDRTRR